MGQLRKPGPLTSQLPASTCPHHKCITSDSRKRLTGDLQKPHAPKSPARGSGVALILLDTRLWLIPLPRPGEQATGRQVTDPLPPLRLQCQLGQDPLVIHSPQQLMPTLPEAKETQECSRVQLEGMAGKQVQARESREAHLSKHGSPDRPCSQQSPPQRSRQDPTWAMLGARCSAPGTRMPDGRGQAGTPRYLPATGMLCRGVRGRISKDGSRPDIPSAEKQDSVS